MVKNIIFVTLIFIISGCGMMGNSSSKDTSLYDTGTDSSVAITDLNSSNIDNSNLVADSSIDNNPDSEPTTEVEEGSILPQTISIDFPDILKQDISKDDGLDSEDNETTIESSGDEVSENIDNSSSENNSTIAEIGYSQLKENISRIEDVVKIAQINLILLEKVMPQVLDKCEGMISCIFEPKYLSVELDRETISKIDEIVDDKNFTIVDKDSRVSLGEIAFTKKSVDEGYDYELKLDMLSDDTKLNNLYKDENKTEINSSLGVGFDIDRNQTDINSSAGVEFDIDENQTDINITLQIETNTTQELNRTNWSDLNQTDTIVEEDINSSDTNLTEDIGVVEEIEDINLTTIEDTIESEDDSEDIEYIVEEEEDEIALEDAEDINESIDIDDNNSSEVETEERNVTIKEYQIFKWSDYNRDVITTYVYDNNESIINISIYYLVDEYGKETMHIYNTNNKDGHKENMNLTLASKDDDNLSLILQANSIEQSFDGNETNISSFSSNGEISDSSSLLLFSGRVSNNSGEDNVSNTTEVICDGNLTCSESNSSVDEIPELNENLQMYELEIKDGNLTDGSYILLPPYTDINGLTLLDIFSLTLGTFTISDGKAQGQIHNNSYNDMLDRLTIVEIDEQEESKTKFKLIDNEYRPNIKIIEP